jgi:transposase InsO family protein
VELIMRRLGIKGLPTRRLPRGARLARITSLDLVGRQFRRDAPDELWMTDITEHPTREGKVYCCVVLDAFSRLVVGWSIDSAQTTTLVLDALGMATRRRSPEGDLVIHSDRGPQFTSWAFSQKVKGNGSPRRWAPSASQNSQRSDLVGLSQRLTYNAAQAVGRCGGATPVATATHDVDTNPFLAAYLAT